MMLNRVAILGSGAFGTAITNVVADNGIDNFLWSKSNDLIQEITQKNTNDKYLPGVNLSQNINITLDLELALKNANIIFIVVPSNAIVEVIEKIYDVNKDFSGIFVICAKGVDCNRGGFFSDLFKENFKSASVAVLSGPNFAIEIAQKIPTITTIASEKKESFDKIASVLNCDYFATEYSTNLIGTQIAGTIKNIIAIACGIAEGMELGRNTISAIITQGAKEISKICSIAGVGDEVLNSAAGIGDLVLTCTSRKSRNMSFGFELGQGAKLKDLLTKNSTFEGVSNAGAMIKLARKQGIYLSLVENLNKILSEDMEKEKIKEILVESFI